MTKLVKYIRVNKQNGTHLRKLASVKNRSRKQNYIVNRRMRQIHETIDRLNINAENYNNLNTIKR